MVFGGDGDPVPGHVIRSADTPRTYIVSTPTGLVRRSHLVSIPKREEHQEPVHQPSLDANQDVIPELHVPALVPVPELPASTPV